MKELIGSKRYNFGNEMTVISDEGGVLNFNLLKEGVASNAAAFRKLMRLSPAGGVSSKVFPPTLSGGVYAFEKRRISAEKNENTVLLDSVQSQANRMEIALLKAYRSGELKIPLLQVDFAPDFPEVGKITTLDAPHRIADAIFRDSLLQGKRFRESDVGKEFESANTRNSTPLLKYCPQALIFGVWDSTGAAGGLGNKFQRLITSEIVGFGVEPGVHTSSRIDPLGIAKVPDFYEGVNGDWTLNASDAKKDKKGNVVKKKPSDFVLGNILPTIDTDDNNHPIRGGVTIDYALQTIVISLPALRRLHFHVNGSETPRANIAARTFLAALAIYSAELANAEGYDLRSGCLLLPQYSSWEFVTNDGSAKKYLIDLEQAKSLLDSSIKEMLEADLPWEAREINLVPEKRLKDLIKKSHQRMIEPE